MKNSVAALYIQSFYRGYRTRIMIRHMHIAAIQIQKVYRGFVVRTRMRPKRAIFQHRNSIDNQIQDTEKRILLLESQMRGLSQANASRMLRYESERRERAARVIQTHFKGYLARKVYSRAPSPIKSVLEGDDKAIDSEDSRRKGLQLWDADEEQMELENAIGSIVNRMHKDQFVHDSLLGLYGGVSREISVINQEISKDRKLTANSIVSKLQVLHSLLDDYYGKVDDNPSAGNLNNNMIAECSSLRNEIEDIVNIVKDGILI